jgi:hypothetical protein
MLAAPSTQYPSLGWTDYLDPKKYCWRNKNLSTQNTGVAGVTGRMEQLCYGLYLWRMTIPSQ